MPVNIGPEINSEYWEGMPRISDDDLALYFDSDRPGGLGKFDIWISRRKNIHEVFGSPKNPGPEINTGSFDGGPELFNHKFLYFMSDRPGGYGSSDIWLIRLHSPGIPRGKAINAGSIVNSKAFDFGPDISKDGNELFFASNRDGGHGDFDIWVSKKK